MARTRKRVNRQPTTDDIDIPDLPEEAVEFAQAAPEPPSEDTQKDTVQRLTDAIESLVKLQMLQMSRGQETDPRQSEIMEKLTGALDRLGDNQLKGSELIASETRRAHRPSNEVVHKRSAFNRRGETMDGYQKPKLKCTMLLPWIAENESLTREEVELLNLLQSGTYVVRRIDNTKVKINVAIDYAMDEVTPSRLVITHETAFNNDYFKLWPATNDWLRQALKQHDSEDIRRTAAAVISDEEEEALIEAGKLTVSV